MADAMPIDLTDPEDIKLITLAKATRARANAALGAAVRDTDGRTYSAAEVSLPSLELTALQVAVAMAHSSGVSGLEAAVVVGDLDEIPELDVGVVLDFAGRGVPIYRADASGAVLDSVTT